MLAFPLPVEPDGWSTSLASGWEAVGGATAGASPTDLVVALVGAAVALLGSLGILLLQWRKERGRRLMESGLAPLRSTLLVIDTRLHDISIEETEWPKDFEFPWETLYDPILTLQGFAETSTRRKSGRVLVQHLREVEFLARHVVLTIQTILRRDQEQLDEQELQEQVGALRDVLAQVIEFADQLTAGNHKYFGGLFWGSRFAKAFSGVSSKGAQLVPLAESLRDEEDERSVPEKFRAWQTSLGHGKRGGSYG